jgi:nucleoside-diphosphate-sugar epimerase
MARHSAVIAGATGMVGRLLTESLAADPGWEVVALARKPLAIKGVRFIAADLTNEDETRRRLGELTDTTHIFYAGRFDHVDGVPEPVDANLAMLRHVVEAIEPHAPHLQHIHLVEGTKWYGSNLGPFPTPAREDGPRGAPANFYHAQEDYLAERRRGTAWTWSASRPHSICHAVPDMPRNLVTVIAAYAVISRELGLSLSFPGTAENYSALYQCTSADHLVEAIRWMAGEPRCANEAFNIINGDHFRWEDLWPRLAAYFGMEAGPVRTHSLADTMADKAPVWNAVVAKHGLRPIPYDRLTDWRFGDYVFTPGWDIASEMTKARAFGFHRSVSTEAEFIRFFDSLRAQHILP